MPMRRVTRTRRSNSTRGGGLERGGTTLMIHGPEFNNGEHVVLNPESFPDIKLMDLVELSQPERDHPRLIVQVTSLAPVRGKLQVSLLKELAAQFGLEAFQPVSVQKVDPSDVTVNFMELTFKDQYLSSADIWRVKVAMFGKCVYVGKTVECLSIRSQVEGLLANNAEVLCGVIGEATKIIVRSRSSRLFWLVQMSAEMWEFAPDGELYYEKLLNHLLRELTARWTAYSVSHSVTIIAFSRTFYDTNQFPPGFNPLKPPFSKPCRQRYVGSGVSTADAKTAPKRYGPTIHVDPRTGQYYEDFYKVVAMSYSGPDWNQVVVALKKEFASYHETHRWRGPDEYLPAEYDICCGDDLDDDKASLEAELCDLSSPGSHEVDTDSVTDSIIVDTTIQDEDGFVKWRRLPYGVPSRAADGNVLEALNVTLNILDKHHMDRDLNRTGQSIVMLTAGCSIFHVDEYLSEITQQRMMDNGVGMDMISLAVPPLHVVPLFIFRPVHPNAVSSSSNDSVVDDNSSLNAPHRKLSFSRDNNEAMDLGSPVLIPQHLLARDEHSARTRGFRGNGGAGGGCSGSCSYHVPHWVNITFLDFDCKCRHETGASDQQCGSNHRPSTWASSRIESPHTQILSHRAHTCACQSNLNHEFMPLPPFRMFDLSMPTEKLSFPIALRNIIHGYPRRLDNKSESGDIHRRYNSGTCDMDLSELPHQSSLTTFIELCQAMSAKSDWHSSSTSIPPPDEWQVTRSPDYNLSLSPKLKRAANNVNMSLITREALLEYDAEVFSPFRPTGDSSYGFGTIPSSPRLPPVEEPGIDLMSVSFDENTNHLLNDELRSFSSKWSKSHGYARCGAKPAKFRGHRRNNTIASILSPRDDKRLTNPRFVNMTSTISTIPEVPSSSHQTSGKSVGVEISKAQKRILSPSSQVATETSGDSIRTGRSRLRSTGDTDDLYSPGSGSSVIGNFERAFPPLSSSEKQSHMHDRNFRKLERSLTMTKAMTSTDLAGSTPRAQFSSVRHSRNESPSLFTAMRRGQSEIFSSTPVTNSMNAHLRSTPNGGHGFDSFTLGNGQPVTMNPFRISTESVDSSSQRLSSDRRRWSHLFPVRLHGQEPAQFGVGGAQDEDGAKLLYIGPNWKSLTTPAILPLTSDYFPSPNELRSSYSESFYTLTLPSSSPYDSVPKYNNHDELLIEMICQRLACDFQLVTNNSYAEVEARQQPTAPFGRKALGGGRYSIRGLDQAPDSQTVVYHLSTGHHIHRLIYDPERQTIEVKQYIRRMPDNGTTACVPYRYSIWVDFTESFHPMQQDFHQLPQHEENWNSMDHLLCGYHDQMSDRSKCRRIRFAIIPPVLRGDSPTCSPEEAEKQNSEVALAHSSKFTKFLDYLQSRVAPSEDGDMEKISVAIELDPSTIRHRPALVLPKGYNTRTYKVCCRTSSASMSSSSSTLQSGPVSSGSKVKSDDTRTEWVMLNVEDTMSITRNYHFDVRWLACSGNVVDEFVGAIKRKAKQAGLELRRLPEFACVSFLQLHPLISPVLLPLNTPMGMSACSDSASPEVDSSPLVKAIKDLEFVLDDERIADSSGIGYGLGIEREERSDPASTGAGSASLGKTAQLSHTGRFPRRSASFTTRMLLNKFRTRGYQQYMHRSLPVIVRVTHHGLVWIPSYEYDEKHEGARVGELFAKICLLVKEFNGADSMVS